MTKKDKVHKVLNDKEIEQSVEEFRAWIAKHPEFPQDLGVCGVTIFNSKCVSLSLKDSSSI